MSQAHCNLCILHAMEVFSACRYETKMVEEIVKKVISDLKLEPLDLPGHFVGVDKRVHDAIDYVHSQASAVKVIS